MTTHITSTRQRTSELRPRCFVFLRKNSTLRPSPGAQAVLAEKYGRNEITEHGKMHQICLDACAQLSFSVRHALHLLRADNDEKRKHVIKTGIQLMIHLGNLAQDILLWYLSDNSDNGVTAKKSSNIPLRLRKAKRNVTKFSNDAGALLPSGSLEICARKQFGTKTVSLLESRQALLRSEATAVAKTLNILPANHTIFSLTVRASEYICKCRFLYCVETEAMLCC